MREPGEDDDMVTVGEVLDEARHRKALGLPAPTARFEVAPTPPSQPRASFSHAEVVERIEQIGKAVASLVDRARARGDAPAVALYEKHLAWCRAKYREAKTALDAQAAPIHHGPDRVMRKQDT